jgi:hypothetical protein
MKHLYDNYFITQLSILVLIKLCKITQKIQLCTCLLTPLNKSKINLHATILLRYFSLQFLIDSKFLQRFNWTLM